MDRSFIAGCVVLLSMCSSISEGLQLQESTKIQAIEETGSKCDRMKAFLSSFTSGNTSVAESTVNPNVIQHNLGVPHGLAGYKALIGSGVITHTDTFRCFETEEYTIGHSRFSTPDFSQICFDVYRWNRGLIAEHWDNCQTEVDSDTNPNTMVDGPTEACCLDETAANVAVIEQFQRDVFVGASSATMLDYYHDGAYIQHNQMLPDGADALYSYVKLLESKGIGQYQSTKFVIGHGNFVLAACLGLSDPFDAMSPPMSAGFDLYRLYDGKIAEHWDTIEAIPDPSTWANTNGKW